MAFRARIVSLLFFLVPITAGAQCPSGPEKTHADTICGLSIGMKPEEVLAIMKRPPDAGQEQGEDIVSAWKLLKGNVVTVRFRKKQYVGAASLDFHPELMARDLELPSSVQQARAAHAYDAGTRLEYQRDETQNGEKIIWYRQVKHPNGYTFEVGFESASRLKVGERLFQSVVESKYITVRKAYLEELDEAMSAVPKKPASAPNTPPGTLR
jgi:hypothetical protein